MNRIYCAQTIPINNSEGNPEAPMLEMPIQAAHPSMVLKTLPVDLCTRKMAICDGLRSRSEIEGCREHTPLARPP